MKPVFFALALGLSGSAKASDGRRESFDLYYPTDGMGLNRFNMNSAETRNYSDGTFSMHNWSVDERYKFIRGDEAIGDLFPGYDVYNGHGNRLPRATKQVIDLMPRTTNRLLCATCTERIADFGYEAPLPKALAQGRPDCPGTVGISSRYEAGARMEVKKVGNGAVVIVTVPKSKWVPLVEPGSQRYGQRSGPKDVTMVRLQSSHSIATEFPLSLYGPGGGSEIEFQSIEEFRAATGALPGLDVAVRPASRDRDKGVFTRYSKEWLSARRSRSDAQNPRYSSSRIGGIRAVGPAVAARAAAPFVQGLVDHQISSWSPEYAIQMEQQARMQDDLAHHAFGRTEEPWYMKLIWQAAIAFQGMRL